MTLQVNYKQLREALFVWICMLLLMTGIGTIIGAYNLNGILGYYQYEGIVIGAASGGVLWAIWFFLINFRDIFENLESNTWIALVLIVGAAIGVIWRVRAAKTWLGILGNVAGGGLVGAVGIFPFLILWGLPILIFYSLLCYLLFFLIILIGILFGIKIEDDLFAYTVRLVPDSPLSKTQPAKIYLKTQHSTSRRRTRKFGQSIKSSGNINTTSRQSKFSQPKENSDVINPGVQPIATIPSASLTSVVPTHEIIHQPRPQIVDRLLGWALKIDDIMQSVSESLFSSNPPEESWEEYSDFTLLNLKAPVAPDNKYVDDHISNVTPNQTTSVALTSVAPAFVEAEPPPTLPGAQQGLYPLPNPIQQSVTSTQPYFASTTRAAIGEVEVKQIHRQMQAEIVRCLYEQQPIGRDVFTEVEGIDILVDDLIEVSLLEIKTGTDCVYVLREAIGQLLEYQFFAQHHFIGRKTRLIVISPLSLDARAYAYLMHLRNTYRLGIEYRRYVPGSYSFFI